MFNELASVIITVVAALEPKAGAVLAILFFLYVVVLSPPQSTPEVHPKIEFAFSSNNLEGDDSANEGDEYKNDGYFCDSISGSVIDGQDSYFCEQEVKGGALGFRCWTAHNDIQEVCFIRLKTLNDMRGHTLYSARDPDRLDEFNTENTYIKETCGIDLFENAKKTTNPNTNRCNVSLEDLGEEQKEWQHLLS